MATKKKANKVVVAMSAAEATILQYKAKIKDLEGQIIELKHDSKHNFDNAKFLGKHVGRLEEEIESLKGQDRLNPRVAELEAAIIVALGKNALDPAKNKVLQHALVPPVKGHAV